MGWLLLIFVVILLLGFYPVRIWVDAKAEKHLNMAVKWQPLPLIPWLVTVKKIENMPLTKVAKETEQGYEGVEVDIADLTKKENIQQHTEELKKDEPNELDHKKNTKQNTKEKKGLRDSVKSFAASRKDLKDLIEKSLGNLSVETLCLKGNLAGDAALSAFGGGILWTFLGYGLGVFSTKVKKYPKHPNIQIGLNPNANWYGEMKICCMVRIGNILKLMFHFMKLILQQGKRKKLENLKKNRYNGFQQGKQNMKNEVV